MNTVLYRVARYEGWSGKYHFKGFVQGYEAMKRDAEEIYQRITYGPNSMEWIVVAGTTPERLGASLDHWNASQLPTCVCTVHSFLMLGALNESSVRNLEAEIWSTPSYTYSFNTDQDMMMNAIKTAMGRVFGSEEKKAPDPTPPQTNEGEEKKGYPWTPEERNRLEFVRWLIKRGVISEECVV